MTLKHTHWRLAILIAAFSCTAASVNAAEARLLFCCDEKNDLYNAATAAGIESVRCTSANEALERATPGSAILLLADDYPAGTTKIPDDLFERAKTKRVRLYVEYPGSVPGVELGEPETTKWERAVVAGNRFGPTLRPMRILAIHDCHYLPATAKNPLLVVAKVAGFDNAVYGLPEDARPLLFEHPDGGALIAVTKLSHFITGRYAPCEAWRTIWHTILKDLTGMDDIPALSWTPSVRPAYRAAEKMPDNAEENALRDGSEWFVDSRLLVHPSDERKIAEHIERASDKTASYAAGWMDADSRILPPASDPVGDGSHGILEGYSSRILCGGSQLQRIIRRSDCIAEAAMGLAFGGGVRDGRERDAYREYSANLMDYLYFQSIAQQGVRADRKHPAFGLVAWGITNWSWEKAFYGDDNARVLLASMASAGVLGEGRWDEAILKCLLGNLRTTGPYGFRPDRVDLPEMERNGWEHYFRQPVISYAPHYQCYLWACYLWAYRQTGFELFLERAECAIRLTVDAYPDDWRWTNGIQQERARMLLPLAWLIRVDDTPEHREWLRRIAEDLLEYQDDTGAIAEAIGDASMGSLRPPISNEEYGTGETPLLQENGDPVCDMLYTSNFAFLGLHEAAAATGDAYYRGAENRLAEFLCRIQIHSVSQPELHGGWFRAFDFDRWEYWASNGDAGWGAWSIESGWTQGWIVAVFGMRHAGNSLWDLTESSAIEEHFTELYDIMFPNGHELDTPERIDHDARKKAYTLAHPYSRNYPSTGSGALTDGFVGTTEHSDGFWQGYHGVDLEVVLDMEAVINLDSVSLNALRNTSLGIFLPAEVLISASTDGTHFVDVDRLENEIPVDCEGPAIHTFAGNGKGVAVRYVRVHARNVGVIPGWHHAAGERAWLFVDEIVVEKR